LHYIYKQKKKKVQSVDPPVKNKIKSSQLKLFQQKKNSLVDYHNVKKNNKANCTLVCVLCTSKPTFWLNPFGIVTIIECFRLKLVLICTRLHLGQEQCGKPSTPGQVQFPIDKALQS
jgi:hypothetical protein